MKIEQLSIAQAVELGLQEPYACITRLSQVEVGLTPAEICLDDVLEARFFGPDREIHFYQEEDGLAAVMLEDEPSDEFYDTTSPLQDARFGKHLTIRQYIVYDEDGQGSIWDIRPVKWEG